MSIYAVIEPKPWHVGQMLRQLRTEHADAVAGTGLNSHRELRNRFDESSYKVGWTIDGKLAALGGVTGCSMAMMGYLWLVVSQEATRHPIPLARAVRRCLDEILQTKRVLLVSVLDDTSIRFAFWLGFDPQTGVRVKMGAGSALLMEYGRLAA